MTSSDKIFPDFESAREALERGEQVCIQVESFRISSALLQLALDLQTRERLQAWIQQQNKKNTNNQSL